MAEITDGYNRTFDNIVHLRIENFFENGDPRKKKCLVKLVLLFYIITLLYYS